MNERAIFIARWKEFQQNGVLRFLLWQWYSETWVTHLLQVFASLVMLPLVKIVFNGEYLVNAQGEDVVAGIRTPQQITKEGSRRWAASAIR
jgi:hypothetical protein